MLTLLLASLALPYGARLANSYPLPDGEWMTVRRIPARHQGRIWSCPGPTFSASDVWGPMKDIKNFSLSGSGIGFTDPHDSKGSGSTTISGVQLKYAEGDKVQISISASNMSLSFHADRCADGKTFYTKGVRDPWDPPRNTLSFSFTFQPQSFERQVSFYIDASPTSSKSFYNWDGYVSWVFTPGEQAQSNTDVHVSDATKTGGDVSFLAAGGDISGFDRLFNQAPPVSGVAADGVSMLVVTASGSKAGNATFTVGGAGGALYPLKSGASIFKSNGSSSVTTPLRQTSSGYGAAVLYRPPSYFGRGQNPKKVVYTVSTDDGGQKSATIDLVRPPVVLVHGTYDNPSFCYEEHDPEDDAPTNLAPLLRGLGYDVSCVDWHETNGDKDPSDFQTNKLTVWQNKDGIKDALAKMRDRNIAVTQVDMVCHSQGGVIARTYIRGYPFSVSMPPTAKHYTDPDHCEQNGQPCWYHRADNFYQGDIHRLITISTTHRGSHVCNLFDALQGYPNDSIVQLLNKLATSIFLTGVDTAVTGITTGGFLNQIPDSLELQLIGPSPVPAHAIACVATDEDMKDVRINNRAGVTQGMGDYYGKLFLIWSGVPNDAKDYAFKKLIQKAEGRGVANAQSLLDEYNSTLATLEKAMIETGAINRRDYLLNPVTKADLDANIYSIRKLVFEGDRNDCTVAMHSSWGLLKPPYITACEHVLHGWAPRYKNVQNKVVQLLVDDGSQFDPNGFPGYSGIQSRAATFATTIRPMAEGVALGGGPSNGGASGAEGGSGADNGGRTFRGIDGGGSSAGGNNPAPIGFISAPPINGSTWAIPINGLGGHVEFSGGELTLSLNDGEEGMPQAFAKNPLSGDFDVSYHYNLKQLPTQQGLNILLLAFRLKPDQDMGQVEFRREDNMGKESVNFDTDQSGTATKPALATQGRLRVRRRGSRWAAFQWAGSGWQVIGVADGPSDPVYPGFVLNRFGPKQPMVAIVRPARPSGRPALTNGVPPHKTAPIEGAPTPGTYELESVDPNMSTVSFKQWWRNIREKNGVWQSILQSDSGTIVYTIRIPKDIPMSGATIKAEIDDLAEPGQGLGAVVGFPDSDFEREPFDRDIQVYSKDGQRATGAKQWRLKPYGGGKLRDEMTLVFWMGDGPHYICKYRVVK